MSAVQPTLTQRGLFEQHGYLRLDQAVSRAQMRPVQRRVIDDLAQRGIDATGRGLPKTIRSLPVFQQIAKFSQFVSIPDLEAAIIPPGVEEMVRALGGTKVVSRQSQLLLSPPRQGQWRVEGLSWHTDVSAHGPRIPGVQAFVLIDDLAEHGGATLVLAGSHAQTKDAGTKSRVRDALHLGEAGMATLRELGLTIVELAGKAGDVYLMDMRTLHTPSVNTSSKIRVVATVRYFLK